MLFTWNILVTFWVLTCLHTNKCRSVKFQLALGMWQQPQPSMPQQSTSQTTSCISRNPDRHLHCHLHTWSPLLHSCCYLPLGSKGLSWQVEECQGQNQRHTFYQLHHPYVRSNPAITGQPDWQFSCRRHSQFKLDKLHQYLDLVPYTCICSLQKQSQ